MTTALIIKGLESTNDAQDCCHGFSPFRWDGEENQKGEKKINNGNSGVEIRTIYRDNTKREITTTMTTLPIKENTKRASHGATSHHPAPNAPPKNARLSLVYPTSPLPISIPSAPFPPNARVLSAQPVAETPEGNSVAEFLPAGESRRFSPRPPHRVLGALASPSPVQNIHSVVSSLYVETYIRTYTYRTPGISAENPKGAAPRRRFALVFSLCS